MKLTEEQRTKLLARWLNEEIGKQMAWQENEHLEFGFPDDAREDFMCDLAEWLKEIGMAKDTHTILQSYAKEKSRNG